MILAFENHAYISIEKTKSIHFYYTSYISTTITLTAASALVSTVDLMVLSLLVCIFQGIHLVICSTKLS